MSDIAKPADAARLWIDRMPGKAQPYLRLMRFDRPIGTWLLYWPCVLGLVLGAIASERVFGGLEDLWLLLLFGAGAIAMRGAGCAYNDIVDREIDATVARTRGRPIPSGAVSVRKAWALVIGLSLFGLCILLSLTPFAIYLGIGSLALVAIYPFMKRITWWPQAWLGLTFNWGALMGFAAQTGTLDAAALLLYAGLFFWTLGYDTIYALQDIEDDALVGVKSTARLFGPRVKEFVLGFYAVAFTLILAAGLAEHAGWPLILLMLAAGGHLLWQVHRLEPDNPANALKLFQANRETGALFAASLAIATCFG